MIRHILRDDNLLKKLIQGDVEDTLQEEDHGQNT